MPPLIAATPLTSVAASPAIVATTSSANNTLPYSSPVGKCILSVKKPTSSEIFNNAYIITDKSYIYKRFYILGIIFTFSASCPDTLNIISSILAASSGINSGLSTLQYISYPSLTVAYVIST